MKQIMRKIISRMSVIGLALLFVFAIGSAALAHNNAAKYDFQSGKWMNGQDGVPASSDGGPQAAGDVTNPDM